MVARTNFLWPVDLVSQVISIVASMTAIMFLLPYFLVGNGGFPTFAYLINGALAFITIINVFIIIGRWQRTKQRVGAVSAHRGQALVCWHYDQQTWQVYAQRERRHAYRLLAQWSIPFLFIGVFVVYMWLQSFGQQIFWPMLIGIGVNLLVILVKVGLLPYYRILNTAPEAIITPDGLCIGGSVYFWRQGNATLRSVTLQEGQPSMLEFKLRVQNGRSTSTQWVRVPVLPGCEAEAQQVVEALPTQ